MENKIKDSEICLHSFEEHEKYWGAIAPPIVQTSLFSFKDWDSFLEGITAEREHYVYTRGVNPTTEILEKKLADLERGEKCKCFTSGIAAISSTIFTLTASGDHILFVNNIYGPTISYSQTLEKFGIEYTNCFVKKSEDIEQYIKENTKLIYIESPSTMNFDVLDLEKISKIAKSKSILTAIDNTCLTPLNQKPLTLGIDIVLHSCTKYIAGHSDTVGGAVISTYEIVDKIFEIGHQLSGGVISPFDSWLIIRGLRTLPHRLEYQNNSIKKIIDYLKNNDKVLKINHPLMFEGEQKQIYDKQSKGYTTLFSIEVDFKNYEQLRNFMNSFKVFKIGVSWGGFESLVTSPNYNTEDSKNKLKAYNQSENLVRLYIGLEDTAILIKDLENAFNNIK